VVQQLTKNHVVSSGRTEKGTEPEQQSVLTVLPLRWGRGHVWRVQTHTQGTVIVRHYCRGGFVRHFLNDLYWDRPPRPLMELVSTETARQRGVPTIEVLGARVRWTTGGLYRGLFVSREAEGFHNLWEWLQRRPTGPTRTATLTAVARTIKAMHDAGVAHADLNLTNILVQPSPTSPVILLLDFDRAQVLSGPVARSHRERALRRLQRSLRKLNPAGSLYSAADLALLCSEPSP
jgi:3-deoxy-D-manno-octulosonic acid kinase